MPATVGMWFALPTMTSHIVKYDASSYDQSKYKWPTYVTWK